MCDRYGDGAQPCAYREELEEYFNHRRVIIIRLSEPSVATEQSENTADKQQGWLSQVIAHVRGLLRNKEK